MNKNNSTNHKERDKEDYDSSFPNLFFSLLTDRQRAIFETVRMRLSPKDAILYLQDQKIPLIDLECYKHTTKLQEPDLERLYHITKVLLKEGILLRSFELALDLMSMWIKYNHEQDHNNRILILREIFPFQHYLSACFETVNDIISLSGSDFSKEYYFTN